MSVERFVVHNYYSAEAPHGVIECPDLFTADVKKDGDLYTMIVEIAANIVDNKLTDEFGYWPSFRKGYAKIMEMLADDDTNTAAFVISNVIRDGRKYSRIDGVYGLIRDGGEIRGALLEHTMSDIGSGPSFISINWLDDGILGYTVKRKNQEDVKTVELTYL